MTIVEGDEEFGPESDDAFRRGLELLDRLGGRSREGSKARVRVPGYAIPPGSLLGSGRFGRVYLGRNRASGRDVAIKILADDVADDAVQRARMEHDAAALAMLQQSAAAEHVVPVLDSGTTEDGRPYLVTEFVDGGNLADRLRNTPAGAPQPLDPRLAAGWIEQLARALHVAHAAGIVHRDLKPQNILLTRDGRLKLCDFGLARVPRAQELTADGELLGTIEYMAPEQARGQVDRMGPAVDVFALGAILYECLTARPPFQGVNPLETLDQLLTRDPVPPEELVGTVPADLSTICLQCLRKDPAARYRTALELAEDLHRQLHHRPIRARRESPLERLRKWRRRNPGWFYGLLLSAAALLVGTAVSLAFAFAALRSAEAAREAKASAEANAAIRLRTLDDAVRTLTGPELRLSGQFDVMRQLLQSLLPRFEEVLRQEGRDPETLAQQGQTWNTLVQIRNAFGELEPALEASTRAEAIFRELIAADPDSPAFKLGLGTALNQRGVIVAQTGKFEEGRGVIGEAITYLDDEGVVDAFGSRVLHQLALARNNLGNCLMYLGIASKDPELLGEAAARYREAIRDFDRAFRAEPADPSPLSWQARTVSNLALLEGGRGNAAESMNRAAEAVGLARTLIAEFPQRLDSRECLAVCLTNEAETRVAAGDAAAALPLFRDMLDLYEGLAAQVPSSTEFRWGVALAESDLGDVLTHSGPESHPEAARRLERAATIYRELGPKLQDQPEFVKNVKANDERLERLRAATPAKP